MMRSLVMALGVLASVAISVPDAQMLLDLDLLHDADPRTERERRIAEQRPLLELLQRLDRAAAQTPRSATPPRASKDDC
jgi:hypothetical protein